MESRQTIKGYELRERIGSGGFGVVYRAYQTSVGREVAIKVILPHFANHPDFIRRFENEAQLVARLEHLHVVPLYDFWRDPEGAYLVMRWLRGGSLRSALEHGPYELPAAALLIDQIASALALAHRNGIVHRDLKPANILLDEQGNAYLSDFGIAKDIRSLEASQTGSDMLLGSPDYLSPEQARSEPILPQTDIYSLGVVLYELLTGRHPFPNLTPVERMYKHLNDPLPQIDTLAADITEGVNAIVQKATAKNPARRYDDVLTLAAEFRRATALSLPPAGTSLVEQLTLREHEILQLIIEGRSNGEIAQQLFVTVGTVKWYVRQIYQKLHVRSRVQAIVRARELNLVLPGAESAPALSETIPSLLPEPENPYKGLRAFQTADARDFFGRESLVRKLVGRLAEKDRHARFLAVIGPSGSGKSSVVKAGLVPALWRGDLPGSDRWFVVELVPGAHPLDELEVALTRIAAEPVTSLREHLQRDARGLVRAAGLILPDDGSELLLLIDQLEELFTLVQDEPTRAHFLALLGEAVTDPRSRVRVVVTLRADFYDRPLHYPQFGELVRSRMETILPLSADDLEAAIVEPARRVGVSFEPGLVSHIISEVHYQPGALPLLQYALTELFEQRSERTLTHAAYQALGGAIGALACRADEAYREQDDAGRNAVRQMFLRLVTPGEQGLETRRRVFRSELLGIASDQELMDEVIDTYTAYRLLTLDRDPATRKPIVEIAHEAILKEWERLRAWLDESRADIRQQRILAAAASEWERADREASYLLRGARLEQVEGWAAETRLALTPGERRFLETSIAERQRQATAESERQGRELETQRQLAEQQRRAASRLRTLAAALAVFLLAAIGLAFLAFGEQRQADDARATSNANAARAEQSAAEAQELALVNGAQAALAQGNNEMALALAVAANRVDHPSAQAQRVLSEAAYRPNPVGQLTGLQAPPMQITFSPDGRLILAGGLDHTGYVWDAATGALLHTLPGHTNWIVDVGIAPDSRTAFTFSRDLSLILWDLSTGEQLRRCTSDLILGPEALSATFTPDGRHIVSNNGATPGSNPEHISALIVWDVSTGEAIRALESPGEGGIGAVAISPDGRWALAGVYPEELVLWDLDTGAIVQRASQHSGDWRKFPSDIAFSADGQQAVVLGMDGVLVLWDMPTFSAVRRLGEPYLGADWTWAQLALHPDGRRAITGRGATALDLWDIQTGAVLSSLPADSIAVALSPDGRTLIVGDWPDMQVIDLASGAALQRFEIAYDARHLALSPDGTLLFVEGNAGQNVEDRVCDFTVFDVASGATLAHFQVPGDAVDTLGCTMVPDPRFSPDGRSVLTGVDERVIRWEAATGARLLTFGGHSATVTSLALSPDGRTVLSGDSIGQILLWDATSGQVIRRLSESNAPVADLSFTADGRMALSGHGTGSVILWDLLTGAIVRRFEGVQGSVISAQISPDGQTVLASAENGFLTLWDFATGDLLHSLAAPGGATAAHFLPDGTTALVDGAALWDLGAGEVIRSYPECWGVVLSPDGRSFFAISMTQRETIRQWRIDALDQLMVWTLDNHYVRELTCNERALYQVQPGCDAAGVFPTRTPYPTAIPSATPAVTAALNALIGTATPTVTPRPILQARIGEQRGSVAVGDDQVWTYEGTAGERLTVRITADQPAHANPLPAPGGLDAVVILTAPDGRDLTVYNSGGGLVYGPPQSDDIEPGINTDALIEDFALPVSGTYQIVVSGAGYRSGGAYTLIVESQLPQAARPVP